MDIFGVSVLAVVVIFVLVVLSKTIHVVPQGYQYTLERLGQFKRVMAPGLHITVPFIESVTHRISMMEQLLEIPRLGAITQDNASVAIDAIAYTQVYNAEKAAYEIQDRNEAIAQLINTSLRNAVGEQSLDSMLSSRQAINAKLMLALEPATKPWGVKITRIEVKELTPPEELIHAMQSEMKAERSKRALILEATGAREAEIARAEGAQRSQILRAEGSKQERVLAAEAELEAAKLQAEARIALADAEAQATLKVSEAIKDGDDKALQYFLGMKYIEGWKDMAGANNAKFVVMPTEMTALSGLLGGLQQFATGKK